MRIGITPLFVLSLSASALAQTSESQSSSNSTDMSLLYAGVDGFLLQQFPLDDSQLSSKAITAAASNQSLTPVGKSPTTQQPPLPVNKLVFAHFIVGNTYNYTVNSWKAGQYPLSTLLPVRWLTPFARRHHSSELKGYRCLCSQRRI